MKRTEAPGNVGNLYVDRNIQMGTAGTTLMAEDRNNIQEEICNPILTGGAALNGNDQHQLEKSIIALSRQVGELILTDVELTPKEYAGATGENYCPVIPRHDADHDIDDTVVPQSIIDKLNAVKWNFNGTEDYSCTVSGSSVVVESTTAGNALVAALVEQGMVNRWFNTGENANYASQGALYSGKRAFCLTIASVNYEITGVNALTNTLTVGDAPGDGVKTMSVYPHRIGGVSNKSRLRKISGEALIAESDASLAYAVANHRMDSIQHHFHQLMEGDTVLPGNFQSASGSMYHLPQSHSGSMTDSFWYAGNYKTVSGYGAVRYSKNTSPRAYGVNVYTHLRYLLSTNWTSN